MLKKARRHHAARLHKERKNLATKREELPVEEDLSKLESEITVYETKKDEVESRSATLKKLEAASEHYRWAENALSDYEKIISGQPVIDGRAVTFIAPKPRFHELLGDDQHWIIDLTQDRHSFFSV